MLVRILSSILALAAIVAGAFYLSCSRMPPVYTSDTLDAIELQGRMRSPEEHDAVIRSFGRPYVFEAVEGDGALLLFGARHTSDRNDPQIASIESRWSEFEPTVALSEGRRNGYLIGPLFPQFAGEPEVVHELARRDDVRLVSLEPDYETEVRMLLKEWTPEQLALYYTLRVYASEAAGEADERLASHLLRKRTDVEGLRGSLESTADLDRVWQRDFPDEPDWRVLREEPRYGYLSEISEASRRVRGEHMARTLIDLVRRGERVFAVVGSGHVVRLEWILRNAFGLPPAFDQSIGNEEVPSESNELEGFS